MTRSADLVGLAPGVFAVSVATVEGWCGVIAGKRRTLVLDAGKDRAEGREVARAATASGRAADLLVYSHGHWDHARGGGAFGGAEIVVHSDAQAMVLAELTKATETRPRSGDGERPASADEGPTGEADSDPEAGRPSIIVSGEVGFDLGSLDVRLIPTPGHAPGAVCLLLPSARILFASDTVVTAIPPAFADGSSAELETTLRLLARLDLEVLVPGHGQIIHGSAAIREALGWVADYLARVRDEVARLAASHGPDEIVALTEFRTHVGDRLPADRHRMVWRHEQTVRRMLAERAAETTP
jgi:glyoxylase-like metal-dependent hydrolase (beta-lactamase superfamily II)